MLNSTNPDLLTNQIVSDKNRLNKSVKVVSIGQETNNPLFNIIYYLLFGLQ